MRKILLVDDEVYIRKGVRVLIERSDSAFKEIQECDNGKSALEIIKSQKPDLVIVDVRMPFMDGIALLREVQNIENKPKFIILSGFDDFKYAKEAIKYGVNDYLLKPVDRFGLIESLNKVEKQLNAEENNSEKVEHDKEIMKQFVQNELNYILLNKNLNVDSIRKILDAVKLDLFDDRFSFAVAYMHLNGKFDDHESFNAIVTFLQEYFIIANKKSVGLYDIEGNYVMVFEGEIDHSLLFNFLNEKQLEDYFIGISGPGHGLEEIHLKYDHAYEALKYRLIKGRQCIYSYLEIESLNKDYKISNGTIHKIAEMTGVCKLDEIIILLNEIFDVQKRYNWNIEYFEKTSESINKYIIDRFIQLLPNESDSKYEEFELLKNICNFENIEHYLIELYKFFSQMNEYLVELKKELKEQNSIDIAIQWIHENYNREDLTMTFVANQVSLNYSYFSLAFKAHTGMGFVNYVKKIRIEKSKELLSSTALKIHEIAQMVGYQNPKLFSKSFKEEIGISPFDYSKKTI